MGLFQNAKVGTKLVVSSSIAVLLIAGMVFNQQNSSRVILAANQTVENEQTILDGIVNATVALGDMRFAEFRLRSATSPEEIRKAVETGKSSADSAWAGLEQPISIAKVPDILNTIRSEMRRFEQEIAEEAGTRAKDIARDSALLSGIMQVTPSDAAAKAEEAIKGSVQNARRFTQGAKVELKNAVESANTFGLGIGLAVIALLIASAFMLMASIARPIRSMTLAMRKLAAGDTQTTIPCVGQRDEIGEMAATVLAFRQSAIDRARLELEADESRVSQNAQRERQTSLDTAKAEDLKAFVLDVENGFAALSQGDLTVRMARAVAPEFEPIRLKFNDSISQLEEALISVIGAIGSIRVGLNQITIASGDLSQRTEQQAASLEETVAALAEVTNAVKGSADGAERAQNSAVNAQRNAEKGGEIVAKAIGAMSAIEQSSDKIGKIIGVIDEIAFQTNLLALNAGVEAARAGEAGRGFAVVAQEVRGLAQRSAEAAKEIKDLISMSRDQVEQGVELVTASGQSLNEIVTQVAEMSSLVVEIARSAKEQSISLKEVSVAADQMDKVTQQNAAMVEETTAAAQSLSTETEDLSTLMDRFRTKQLAGTKRESARANGLARRGGQSQSRSAPVAQLRTVSSVKAVPQESNEWSEF